MPPKDRSTTRQPAGMRDAIVLFALVVIGASLCNLSQTGLNAMISPVMDELGIDVDTGQWLTSAYTSYSALRSPSRRTWTGA